MTTTTTDTTDHLLHRPDRSRRRASDPTSSSSPTATPSSCASRPSPSTLGDDRVRMLAYNGSIPGPDAARAAGLGDHRPRPQRRRHRSDRPLARPAPRQRLRRRALRDPGADRRSAASSPTGCGSPTPACTGTTPTSARTTASTWACTATSSSTPPTTTTGRRSNREYVVTLDDVLVEDGRIAPFNVDGPTHVAMGRFGNVMLTGGETEPRRSTANAGEVVRFYFTNTANTRLFNVAAARRPDEAGRRRQRPLRARDVRRRGAARAVGARHRRRPVRHARARSTLEHRTPDHTYMLGTVDVGRRDRRDARRPPQFEELRTSDELTAERRPHRRRPQRAPDKTLAFKSLMPLLYGDDRQRTYTCPMHPDVSRRAGTCPSAA